jgi:hypothetical protein
MKLLRTLRHKMPDISRRVVAERSGREIADLRAHFGHEIRTTIYFYNNESVLAVPLTGTPGNMQAELLAPLVEEEPVSDERLGFIALQSLLSYRSEPAPSLRDWKIKDWATFKASGAKSVKAFNLASTAVSLETLFGGIRIEAGPLVPNDSVFAVRAWAPISVAHSELGQLLRKVVRGAFALRDAGVV